MPISVQVLTTPGCRHGAEALDLVREVIAQAAADASVETVTVATAEDAERLAFPGSPTVLVDGRDIDPACPPGAGLG